MRGMKKWVTFLLNWEYVSSYDPVDISKWFSQDDENYIVDNWLHIYEIPKNTVSSYEFYYLCDFCKRQLFDWKCYNCE